MYEHFYISHIREQILLQLEDGLRAVGIRLRLIAEIWVQRDIEASLV